MSANDHEQIDDPRTVAEGDPVTVAYVSVHGDTPRREFRAVMDGIEDSDNINWEADEHEWLRFRMLLRDDDLPTARGEDYDDDPDQKALVWERNNGEWRLVEVQTPSGDSWATISEPFRVEMFRGHRDPEAPEPSEDD